MLDVRASGMAAVLCPKAGEQNRGPLISQAFPSGLQPEETEKREKTETHWQCRQSSLDQEFTAAQGRTLKINCGTRFMQQSVIPVLKPLQRPQVLQTDLELCLQLHRHIKEEANHAVMAMPTMCSTPPQLKLCGAGAPLPPGYWG